MNWNAGDDRMLAVAKEAGEIKGFILASRSWNNYVSIHEFAVDIHSRNGGVGRSLMDAAVKWTADKRLPGIRAETQSNNVPACRFYQ